MSLEQLRREWRTHVVDPLVGDEQRDVPHVLDTAADDEVVDAARDERGREVDCLLPRTALLDATRDHVLDRSRVDTGAVEQLDERRTEERVRVDVLVVATLRMTPPDGR